MRPIIRWALLGIALSALSALPARAASLETTVRPAYRAAHDGSLILSSGGWLGLRIRPVSIARLIGAPVIRADDDEARQPLLGAAPGGGKLVSVARRSTDAPSDISPLRAAPRFSRLPGKQTDDYAAGLSAAFADRSIALQGGVFHSKYRNLQTTVRQNGMLMTATAGKAKLYGVEGLASWSPDPHVSLFARGSYSENRLKNRFRDGRKFRLSSDRSASFGAVLALPVGAGRIAFTPSIAYRSAMGLGDSDGAPGAATLVNAQLGYAAGGGFAVEALVSNLLNDQHDRRAAGAPAMILAEPRVIGLRARLRFGQQRP